MVIQDVIVIVTPIHHLLILKKKLFMLSMEGLAGVGAEVVVVGMEMVEDMEGVDR